MTNDQTPDGPARLDAMTARLDAPDAQNRRLKQLLVAVLALAAAVGVRAQVAPTAVSSDRFVSAAHLLRQRRQAEAARRPRAARPDA